MKNFFQKLWQPVTDKRLVTNTHRQVCAIASSDASSDVDGFLIIKKAVARLARFSWFTDLIPVERRSLGEYIERLPDREHRILALWERKKTCREIAEIMQMSIEDVRAALVAVYAGMRMHMRGIDSPPPGEIAPQPEQEKQCA